MSVLKEWALNYAENGFAIFPVAAGEKKPRVDGGSLSATNNPEQIERWWTQWPDANIGLPMAANGLCGIDNDIHEGGDANFVSPDSTYTTISPRGGLHTLFKDPLGKAKNNKKLGHGLTIRSGNYYFVMPPSVFQGNEYKLHSVPIWKAEIQEVPDWIIQLPEYKPGLKLGVTDDIGSRHDTLRDLIVALRHDGKSYEEVIKKAIARRNTMSNPHEKTDREVMLMVDWAFRQVVPEKAPAPITLLPTNTEELVFEWPRKAIAGVNFNVRGLVKGILDHGALSILYGQSNVGKSFVAIDLAYHITLGTPWFGKKTDKGAALYVAAEGGGAIRKRLMAFERHHKLSVEAPLALVPSSINLLDPAADTGRLIEAIKRAGVECGLGVRFVVIDTLARAIAGGNENEGQDMGALLSNLDLIRQVTGAHVMAIHHSGKDITRGARGHSSLRAALDTEMEIVDGKIRITKQRDLDAVGPIDFELKTLELGRDLDGDPITSCVVVEKQKAEFINAHQLQTDQLTTLLAQLEESHGIGAPSWLGLEDGAVVVLRHRFLEEGKRLLKTERARPITDFIRTRVISGVLGVKDEFIWFA